MAGNAGTSGPVGTDMQDEVDKFQRRVEEALEDVDGNKDVAAEVREAVAEAARSQGAAGVSSAIQAASKSMDRIIAEHKARADAAQPSTGSVLSNIASTIAQAAVGGGEAAASRLLLGLAIEGQDAQEWIAAAPGSIFALVDLLRGSGTDTICTAAQTLIILTDIPHSRQDALTAGAVQHVTRLLEPVADDAVTIVEELAVLLLSKLALEPQAHAQIAATAAIPVLTQAIAMARDAGREHMLIGVLRTLGAVSENSTSNASRVIAARGLVPAFQLLSSRLPAVRQAAAFTLGCLFNSSGAPTHLAELTSIEGRLTHYLSDLLVKGNSRDQAYGAVLLARVLAASSNAANVAREMICNSRALDALLRMLASSDLSVQLAAVRALAKISWLGFDPGQPPTGLTDAFVSNDTLDGSAAIENLTDLLDSHDELTRYTAAKVVIVLWTTGVSLQTLITKHTYKATGMAVAETLQMVGCSSSRADVLELCAAVLHVKSGPSVLESVQLCPDWATYFWAPASEVLSSKAKSP